MGDRQDSDDDSTEDTMKEPVAKRMKRSRNGEPVGMDLETGKGKMEQISPAEDSASEDEEATPRNLIDPEASSSDTRDQRRMEMNSAKKVKERARRGKMADSVRSLRVLVPSCIDDKKVNQSQVLANTVAYITKVQAQLSALQKEVEHLKSQLSPSPLDIASKPSPSPFPNQRNVQGSTSGTRGRSVQTLKTAFSSGSSPSEAPIATSRNSQYPSIKLTTKEGGRGRAGFSSNSTRSSQLSFREESHSGIYHKEEGGNKLRSHPYREGPITISSTSPVHSPLGGSFNEGLNDTTRGIVDSSRRLKTEGGMMGSLMEGEGTSIEGSSLSLGGSSISLEGSSISLDGPSISLDGSSGIVGSSFMVESSLMGEMLPSIPSSLNETVGSMESNSATPSSMTPLGGVPDASLHTASFLQAKNSSSRPMIKTDIDMNLHSDHASGVNRSDGNSIRSDTLLVSDAQRASSREATGFGYSDEHHPLDITLSQQQNQQQQRQSQRHGVTSTSPAHLLLTNSQPPQQGVSGGLSSRSGLSASGGGAISSRNHSSSMNIPSSSRHTPSTSSRYSISLLESALSTTPIGDSPFDQTFGSLMGHKDLHRMEEDVENTFGPPSSFERSSSFERGSSFDKTSSFERSSSTLFNQPPSFNQTSSSSYHPSSLSFDPPSLDDIEDVGRWPLYGHSSHTDDPSSHHHHIIDDHNMTGEFDWSIPPQEAEASTLRHPTHAFPHSHTPQPPLPSSSSSHNLPNNNPTEDFPPTSPSTRTSSVCECGKAPVYSGYF